MNFNMRLFVSNDSEIFEDFFFDIKSMSTLLNNWCLTDAEIDDTTLFLAISIKKRIEEFEKAHLSFH